MPPAVLIQKRPLARQGEVSPSAFQIRASGATRPAGNITLYQKNLWFQLWGLLWWLLWWNLLFHTCCRRCRKTCVNS